MNLRDAIRQHLDVVQEAGDEWLLRCPNPEHNDRSPSASVYVGPDVMRTWGGKTKWRRQGYWICYSCGAGGQIRNFLAGIPISANTVAEELEALDEILAMEAAIRTFPERWLDQFDYPGGDCPYWSGRGFGRDVQQEWRLGYELADDREVVTYPMRDHQGRVLGVVQRRIDGGKPKYKYPKHLDAHNYLFGYERLGGASEVVLVEGALDAISLWQVGIPAVGIYGSRLSLAQAELLNKTQANHLILAFDQDDAGEEAIRYVLEGSPRRNLPPPDLKALISIAKWSGAKDVAELSPLKRVLAIKRAEMVLA